MFGITPEVRGITDALDDLNRQLDRFQRQVHVDVKNLTVELAIKMYEKIVERTPIDTGMARANWKISFGSSNLAIITPSWVDGKTLSGRSSPKRDTRTRLRFGDKRVESTGKFQGIKHAGQTNFTRQIIKKFKEESKGMVKISDIYISNNLHYIEYLEGGRVGSPPWGSFQAPQGMIAITLQDFAKYMDLFAAKYQTLK